MTERREERCVLTLKQQQSAQQGAGLAVILVWADVPMCTSSSALWKQDSGTLRKTTLFRLDTSSL